MTDDERFDAFGMTVFHGGSSPTTTPYGFVGKKGYQTDTSGLMLLGHRYYDAGIGRFLSRDPIHDGNNWYAYCGNNPLDKTDASGEQASVEQAKDEPDYSTNIVSDTLDKWLFGGAAKNAGNMQGLADSGAVPQSAATKAELNVAGQIAMMALPETKGGEIAKAGLNIGKHTLQREAERGINEKMIQTALKRGKQFWDPKNKTVNHILQGGFASGKDLLVGRNPVTGKITTVIRGRNLASSRMIPIP